MRGTLSLMLLAVVAACFGVALLLTGMRLRSAFEVNVGGPRLRVGCASSRNRSKFYVEHDGPGIRYLRAVQLVWDDSRDDSARHSLLGFGYGTGVWADNGGGYVRMVTVPMWFPALGTGTLLAWACVRAGRAHQARRPGRCAKCGYDVRASPHRCPECGATPAARRATA